VTASPQGEALRILGKWYGNQSIQYII